MAKGFYFDEKNLRAHRKISAQRGVQTKIANTEVRDFDCFEHRGGIHSLDSKRLRAFLSNSLGSAAELETQILLSREFEYFDAENEKEILVDLSEVGKILTVIRKKLLHTAT